MVTEYWKGFCFGAVAGAVAIGIIGFTWGGWVTGGTANQMAKKEAESAVVKVLAPICVEKFQQQAGSVAALVAFKKASSWDQRSLIEKSGWATTPGTKKTESAVVGACAEKLGRLS